MQISGVQPLKDFRFGLCVGTQSSRLQRKPHWLVDVHRILPIASRGDGTILEEQSIENWQTLVRSNPDSMQGLKHVGYYACFPADTSTDVREKAISLFDLSKRVIVLGNLSGAMFTCVWRNAAGSFVDRDLMEIVPLAELGGSRLENLMNIIRKKCAGPIGFSA
jgi:hypothetical protein